MILDSLEHSGRYIRLHPRFEQAFAFLRREDLPSTGRIDIDAEKLFVLFSQAQGKQRTDAFLEAHRRYIDIHLCVEGVEEIGWRPIADCARINAPYDDEKDLIAFADDVQSWSRLVPETFAIYFPEDAHAPMVSDGLVTKAVVKVLLY